MSESLPHITRVQAKWARQRGFALQRPWGTCCEPRCEFLSIPTQSGLASHDSDAQNTA